MGFVTGELDIIGTALEIRLKNMSLDSGHNNLIYIIHANEYPLTIFEGN
jgi:hypothetical protein